MNYNPPSKRTFRNAVIRKFNSGEQKSYNITYASLSDLKASKSQRECSEQANLAVINSYLLKVIEKKDMEISKLKAQLKKAHRRQPTKIIVKTEESEKRGPDVIHSLGTPFKRVNRTGRRSIAPNFYESLSALNSKSTKFKRLVSESFLNRTNNALNFLIDNPITKEIKELCENEELFRESILAAENKKLVTYCDNIQMIMKEYKQALTLIKRVKVLFSLGKQISTTLSVDHKINKIVKNLTSVLDCDRAAIFVHDNKSNNLVIHTADSLSKGQVSTEKNKGIAGFVFRTGQPQRVEDAYTDARFNRNIDIKLGYKTKTVICYPLIDGDGKVFGVIQGLNKNKGVFSTDDEELMEMTADQAAVYLRSSLSGDGGVSFANRMKNLCILGGYLIEENSISAFKQRVKEQIEFLFGMTQIKFFEKIEERGIIGESIRKKNIIFTQEGYKNESFNSLVDLETVNCLVTVPFCTDDSVFGGFQFVLHSDKLKKEDLEILEALRTMCSTFLSKFY